MPKFNTVCNSADARVQQVVNTLKTLGKTVKSSFQNSPWKDGLQFAIVGFDYCFDEDRLAKAIAENPGATPEEIAGKLRAYPVLKTQLIKPDGSRIDFSPLWLSMLISPKEDFEGNEFDPSGSFNLLAKEKYVSSANDEDCLKAIINDLAGRTITCKRQTKYTIVTYNRQQVKRLVEFDMN